jgi:hypothetical protein
MLPDEIEIDEESINSKVTGVTTVTGTDDGACSGNPEEFDRVTRVTERPYYAVYDESTEEYGKAGVYYHSSKTNAADEVTCMVTDIEIGDRARQLARENGQLGLIVVDYDDKKDKQFFELSESLKALAKELYVPVFVSQFNRKLEK